MNSWTNFWNKLLHFCRDNKDYKSGSSRGDSNGRDRIDFTKNEPSKSIGNKSSFRETNRLESNRGDFSKKDYNTGLEATNSESNKFGGNRKQDQSRSRINTTKKSEIQREKLEIGKSYDVSFNFFFV